MVTFEIPVELVSTRAHEEASSMVKVNINTNPTSTKMESWLEVVQFVDLRLANLEKNISHIYEGDAWICNV